MKRGKKMILLLAVLAVMIGGYFGVQGLNQKNSVTETTGTFDLTTKKTEDLMGLSWTIGDTTRTFKLNEGLWETMDEESWPVNQEVLQDLADQLVNLQATRKLEDVSDPADYGLGSPSVTVTAVWTNGTSTTYSMGDATPFQDGYYLSLSGQDGIVYTATTSLSDLFSKTQSELTAMEDIPVIADVTGIRAGASLNLIKVEESKTVDPDQLWYDADTEEPVDGEQAESLVSAANAIAWNELETANADAEQLGSWMLSDEKAFTVTLTGAGNQSMTILIGASKGDEYYYARLPESSMAYTVKSEDVLSLMNVDKESLQISAVLPMPYDTLASAEFVTEKGSYALQKQTEAGQEENSDPGSDESDLAEEDSSESASDQSADAQKALWEQIVALKCSGSAEGSTDGLILSIHAVNTAGKETTVVFSEYSAEYYQVSVDGKASRLVSAEEVDAIIRAIRSLQ